MIALIVGVVVGCNYGFWWGVLWFFIVAAMTDTD